MRPRYDFIEKSANTVLSKCGTPQKFKISIKKICHKLKFVYIEEPLESNCSGMSVVDGEKKTIIVNSGHNEKRRKFSVAHEIGHILLHGYEALNIDNTGSLVMFRNEKSSKGTDWKEREANYFAACLLMPKDKILEVTEKFNKGCISEDQLEELSDKFGVSVQAMCIRLTQLGFVTT